MSLITITANPATKKVSVDKPYEEITRGEKVKWICNSHDWVITFMLSPFDSRTIKGKAGQPKGKQVRPDNSPGVYKYTVTVPGVGEQDPELIDEGEEEPGGQ